MVIQKLKMAFKHNLHPILCVGYGTSKDTKITDEKKLLTKQLLGALDGVNFDPVGILTHTDTVGNKGIAFSGGNMYALLYFRLRCTGLVLGSATNIVASVVGLT